MDNTFPVIAYGIENLFSVALALNNDASWLRNFNKYY